MGSEIRIQPPLLYLSLLPTLGMGDGRGGTEHVSIWYAPTEEAQAYHRHHPVPSLVGSRTLQ